MNGIKDEWMTECGSIRLLLGDCLEILPGLEKVDAVVTDPPYGLEWREQGFKKQPILDYKEAKGWDLLCSDKAIKAIKCYSSWIIWGGNYYASAIGDCPSLLVWDKMTGKNLFADCEIAFSRCNTKTTRIFRHQWCGVFKDSERGEQNLHPTQKPVALMEWCLGFLPNTQTILDPFMGSGTTGVACIRLGRRFIGIEKEPKYFEIAKRRIRDELDKTRLIEKPKKLVQKSFVE